MKITDLQQQKNRKNRYSVFVDGKYSFSLDLNTISRWNYHIGDEISQDEIEKLKKKDEFWKARDYCLRILSYRDRTESEVRKKLKDRGYSKWTIEEVIRYLKDNNLVDDRRFAENWLDSMMNTRPMGKFRALLELKKYGVSDRVAEEVCQNKISYEVEKELADKAAEKKMRSLANYDTDIKKQRLSNFLKSRGFDFTIIEEILKEYFGEEF